MPMHRQLLQLPLQYNCYFIKIAKRILSTRAGSGQQKQHSVIKDTMLKAPGVKRLQHVRARAVC